MNKILQLGCNCGAHQTTPAGYRQMTPERQRQFSYDAANCDVCRWDRKAAERRAEDASSEGIFQNVGGGSPVAFDELAAASAQGAPAQAPEQST